MKFLRNFIAAVLGSITAFGILFFMILIFAMLAGSVQESIPIPDSAILRISLSDPIKDYGGKYYFTDLQYKFENYDGLNHILQAIHIASTDNRIKGISIDNTASFAGIAQLKAIRDALHDFKASGKFVYAYSDSYTQKDYYLASIADSVFLNPMGTIDFKGLASEILFFKDFQDKSGVTIEVIRHGKYKSAVEPFLANEMSDANRRQLSELLFSLWNSMLNDISNTRHVPVRKLNTIADRLEARIPDQALHLHLIDHVAYYDTYEKALKSAMKTPQKTTIDYVDITDYAQRIPVKNGGSGIPKIAVIYAQGEIFYGEGTDEFIGQEILTEALKKARENTAIKAIVLRIDSPGGSALASDIIWREIEITKTVKPLIVSMGNLAASGGYYIACGAKKIYAEPTTITGSIGVFGILPNIKRFSDKIGINAEHVTTNDQALGYSIFEPLSDAFKAVAIQDIERIYSTFITRVAQGRNMTPEAVDQIAQGRVWSGKDAVKIGLVDELGGLDSAIAYAAKITNMETYTLVNYPVYKTRIEEVIERILGIPLIKNKARIITDEIGTEAYKILKRIQQLTLQKDIQARLPFDINIR